MSLQHEAAHPGLVWMCYLEMEQGLSDAIHL
jgi:hypothetical protein